MRGKILGDGKNATGSEFASSIVSSGTLVCTVVGGPTKADLQIPFLKLLLELRGAGTPTAVDRNALTVYVGVEV
jgi:hypothetical protein